MHPTLWLIPLAFLSGSVPFGYLIGRWRGVDIRQHGSKNIGATNVGRVLGRKFGVLCFVLDMLKGLLPALLAGWWLGVLGAGAGSASNTSGIGETGGDEAAVWWWLACAAAAILGHLFTPWLRFKGGKGVATGFGALLGVWPVLGVAVLGALVVWVISLKISRYVGLSSCLAALSLPIFVALRPALAPILSASASSAGAWWALMPYLIVATALAALVIFKHRGNLARTLAGTEPKVKRKNTGRS